MPKVKVHLRIAQNTGPRRGYSVASSLKPVPRTLSNGRGEALPTIAFAIELDIDPQAFRSAERVIAELTIGEDDTVVAAEVAP